METVQARVVTKGEGKGSALPARLLVKRSVRRIAIQTLSAHFFVPPAGELSGLFFRTGGWTLGDWTMVRALPRTKAQTHKLGWSVEKCFAPGTGRDKKKYMYTFDFSVNVLVKRSSRRTRGLLFIHDHECPFQGMCVEVC